MELANGYDLKNYNNMILFAHSFGQMYLIFYDVLQLLKFYRFLCLGFLVHSKSKY